MVYISDSPLLSWIDCKHMWGTDPYSSTDLPQWAVSSMYDTPVRLQDCCVEFITDNLDELCSLEALPEAPSKLGELLYLSCEYFSGSLAWSPFLT